MLEGETLVEYHRLRDNDAEDGDDDNEDDCNYNDKQRIGNMNRNGNPSLIRDMKIRHYQRKKNIEKRQQQYQSQLQRRSRLGLSEDEILEGYDTENLVRALHIETLRYCAENSLEEIVSSKLELEMLQMSIRMMGNSSCSDKDSKNANDFTP